MSTNSSKLIKDSEFLPKLQAAASCRACGIHINFKKLENGKSVAVQDDSNPHRCAEWKTWNSEEG